METVETQLKNLILSRYKSLLNFTKAANMPYSTVDSIFKRGIANANISNVLKVCAVLKISADKLAAGEIVSTNENAITVSGNFDIGELSEAEAGLVLAYRNNPAMQSAVNKLLGIE